MWKFYALLRYCSLRFSIVDFLRWLDLVSSKSNNTTEDVGIQSHHGTLFLRFVGSRISQGLHEVV